MDPSFDEALRRGIADLGLAVDEPALGRLRHFADRLLAWNARMNLTAVRDPVELAEKHFVDSLALLPHLGEVRTLLDVGTGAGLPGMALACARPELAVTCCDSVGKKVSFVKLVSAELGLRVRAVAVRAAGDPEKEGLGRAEAVVSRALADPGRWVPLGVHYLAEGGRLFGMLGREVDDAALSVVGSESGLELETVFRFTLPVSGAQRAIVRWRRPAGER